MELGPECRVAIAECGRGAHRCIRIDLAATEGGGGIGETECDVLDQDVEVVLTLPVAELLLVLGRLRVYEVGLQAVAIALQQCVCEGAVTPPDTVPVEINKENRKRIEESP
jgi:hypothetical protein